VKKVFENLDIFLGTQKKERKEKWKKKEKDISSVKYTTFYLFVLIHKRMS